MCKLSLPFPFRVQRHWLYGSTIVKKIKIITYTLTACAVLFNFSFFLFFFFCNLFIHSYVQFIELKNNNIIFLILMETRKTFFTSTYKLRIGYHVVVLFCPQSILFKIIKKTENSRVIILKHRNSKAYFYFYFFV